MLADRSHRLEIVDKRAIHKLILTRATMPAQAMEFRLKPPWGLMTPFVQFSGGKESRHGVCGSQADER
jgi:hypothetical protein